MEFTDVSGTTVSTMTTMTYANGTKTQPESEDMDLGDEYFDYMLIPAGLEKGDSVAEGYTVDEVKSEFWLNLPRDVCIIEESTTEDSITLCVKGTYDQGCGIAYNFNVTFSFPADILGGEAGETSSITWNVVLTSTTSSLSVSSWFWILIIGVVAAVLVVVVFLFKFRRKRPPPALPPEVAPPPPAQHPTPSTAPPSPPTQGGYCPNCGTALPLGATFCPSCVNKLT